MIQPWRGGPTVYATVETECASTRGVRNALRDRLDFALRTGVAVDVPFPAATRVPATSFFVQLMAVASGANSMVATSRQWEVPVCVRLMVAAAVARWMVATSRLSRRQNSASSTVVARNALLLGAKKFRVDALNSVQRMVVVYDASWQAAIGSL